MLKISTVCLFVAAFYLLIYKVELSNANFISQASVSSNVFGTGVWQTVPETGDVVINEIMWMGSFSESSC